MPFNVLVKNQTRTKIAYSETLIKEFLKLLKITNNFEISILFCGDTVMRSLNFQYRSKNKTTDVLSFPAEIPGILGDIIISISQAKKQAKQGLEHEIAMLLCHGLLHLLGYDHEKSRKDYKIMMDLQSKLLKLRTKELSLI